MHRIDVLVIGRSCLDCISVVDRFPQENQKTPISFRLEEGGGQGGTAACCITRLGGRAAYVGRVGNDRPGRLCLQRLRDFGVGTDHVETVNGGRTPLAYIFVTRSTGARTIMYETSQLPRIELTAALQRLIERAAVILLDPETTFLANDLVRLKRNDLSIVYDCERWRDGMSAMMGVADYFIPSIEFLGAAQLNLGNGPLPEMMRGLKKRIGGDLIVTDGEDGAYFIEGERIFHVAAPPVSAVDTIGAGDNFHAAFALSVARDMGLHRSVKLSVAAASLSCQQYGGREGIPTWDEAAAAAATLSAVPVD